MSDRSRSFLQTEERKSLREQFQRFEETDEEDGTDYEVDGQQKYRIKDEVAEEDDFRRTIEQIEEDLKLLSFFQYYIRDDGGGYEWEATVLPQTTVELKRLRDRINHLIDLAEDTQLAQESGKIDEIIDSNLYADMDFERLSYDAFEGNMPLNPDPPEIPVDAKEAQQRRDVLPWVLERNYRTEILDYLYGEDGGTDLPDNRVDGGKKWSWYASRYMTEGDSEQKRGLVKKVYETSSHKEYSLTDRGRAVYKTWMELRELPEVDQLVGERKGVRDEGDAVLYLLKQHYSNNDIRSRMFPTDEY